MSEEENDGIALNCQDCDLNLIITQPECNSAAPMKADGFALLFAGVRAKHGFINGTSGAARGKPTVECTDCDYWKLEPETGNRSMSQIAQKLLGC